MADPLAGQAGERAPGSQETDRTAPPIVFIGGTGRSGTNITKDLLAKHPQVATLPFEYRFIIDPDGIVDFYRSYPACWSPYLADKRLKRLESFLAKLSGEPPGHRLLGALLQKLDHRGRFLSPRQYHGWNLEEHLPGFRELSGALLDELEEFSFPAYWVGTESYALRPRLRFTGPRSSDELRPILGRFVCTVIDRYLQSQGKRFFVEDNTWNVLFARELLELVPHGRILHVYRDPRDVVASFVGQRWSPGRATEAALWYASIMRHWLTVRAKLPRESFYELSLERLVGETETVMHEVCHFTGIPWDPILLETDLGKAHSGRWRVDFTRHEQQQIACILDDVLVELGYE